MTDYTDIDKLLGKQSDSSISKKFNVHQTAISKRRRSLNIRAFNFKWIDWSKWNDRLGKQSDYSLARVIGTSTENVHHHRNKLKIKKYEGK